MLLVRVLTAAAKPALVAGALAATAAGGYFAIDRATHDDPTAFQRVQQRGGRLIVSEFGLREDAIVAVDPRDVTSRTTIATIDHAEGFGVFATLAPDGRAIAYTALPADTAKPAPDTPAHAAIVDADGSVTLLAEDVDLLVPPLWSPDASAIVVRKNTPAEDAAGSFELLLLGRDGSRSTITSWSSAAVFPVAFSPDGAKLYFATLSTDGSDLYSVAPDGAGETKIAHLSDEIARDWTLSPDGSTLAYTVAESGPRPHVSARTLDLATGAVSDAVASDGDEFNPAWRRDGGLTVAALLPAGGSEALDVSASGETSRITGSRGGIDLPLAWSPDGTALVVRAVEGAMPLEAGASHVEVVDADGGRQRLSESADVLIVGWLP